MGAILDPIAERLAGVPGRAGSPAALRGPARAATSAIVSAEAGALTGYLSQRVLGPVRVRRRRPARAGAAAVRRAEHRPGGGAPGGRPRGAVDLDRLPRGHARGAVHGRAVAARPPRGPARRAARLARAEGRPGGAAAHARAPTTRARSPPPCARAGSSPRSADRSGARAARPHPGRDGRHRGPCRARHGRRRRRGAAVARRRCARRSTAAATSARRSSRCIERLIGLDAKLRQYEEGKRFCDAVAAAAGPAGLHRVFDGPEQMPSLAELRDPDAWMRRTGVRAAA